MNITYKGVTMTMSFVRSGDNAQASFQGPSKFLPVGLVFDIAGESWKILTAAPSQYISGVTNLWLQRAL